MLGFSSLIAVVAGATLATSHMVINYPGWRGDNLPINGTPPAQNPNTIGIDFYPNGSYGFPYGMQWMYPCGGMPLTQNRTKWPVDGGALSVQPGWFPGHSRAFIYVNIGIQQEGDLAPPNMSHPVVPAFQVNGPTNDQYPGQFCLPQIGMPANLSLTKGQNITIQVIETAQHGAALYSCVDVTLADPSEVEPVTPQNCYNSSSLTFNLIFASKALSSGASRNLWSPHALPTLLVVLGVAAFGMLL